MFARRNSIFIKHATTMELPLDYRCIHCSKSCKKFSYTRYTTTQNM